MSLWLPSVTPHSPPDSYSIHHHLPYNVTYSRERLSHQIHRFCPHQGSGSLEGHLRILPTAWRKVALCSCDSLWRGWWLKSGHQVLHWRGIWGPNHSGHSSRATSLSSGILYFGGCLPPTACLDWLSSTVSLYYLGDTSSCNIWTLKPQWLNTVNVNFSLMWSQLGCLAGSLPRIMI